MKEVKSTIYRYRRDNEKLSNSITLRYIPVGSAYGVVCNLHYISHFCDSMSKI